MRRRPLALLALVGLTTVGGCTAGGAPVAATSSPAPGSATSSSSTPASAEATRAAVQELLDRRAAAVLRHDATGWTATQVPGDPAGHALFDRLATVPLTTWSYDLQSIDAAIASVRTTTPGDRLAVAVRLRLRLAPDTRDLVRDQELTVVRDASGELRVAATTPAAGAAVDPWDLGPVTVREGARSLVVAAGDGEAARRRAEDLTAATDRAAAAVDGAWGTGWPRRVVVLAPADAGQAQALLGPGAALHGLAALTVGVVLPRDGRGSAPDGTADRVVLNPDVLGTLTATGRDVVLRHELTHVATRAQSPWTPPLWLQEGFATWVGYSGAGLPDATVASDALPGVRAGVLPSALPADAAFDAAGGDVAATYAQSWVLCDLIARDGGRDALAAFYRAAAGIRPTAGSELAALDAAFTASGRSPSDLVQQWRKRLRELAAAAA